MSDLNFLDAWRLLQQNHRVKRHGWDPPAYVYLRWPTIDPSSDQPVHEFLSPDLVQVVRGHDGKTSEHLWGPDDADKTATDWDIELADDAPRAAENKPIPPPKPPWG
jgi:hypothetical protein